MALVRDDSVQSCGLPWTTSSEAANLLMLFVNRLLQAVHRQLEHGHCMVLCPIQQDVHAYTCKTCLAPSSPLQRSYM